jgi:hypothetical protein
VKCAIKGEICTFLSVGCMNALRNALRSAPQLESSVEAPELANNIQFVPVCDRIGASYREARPGTMKVEVAWQRARNAGERARVDGCSRYLFENLFLFFERSVVRP